MSFQLNEPVLVIGIGGAGSKLAREASKSFSSECLVISNDQRDLHSEGNSIHVSTKPVLNPSVQLIRGSAIQSESQIRDEVSQYSSVIIMANLAGKSGAAMAPVISQICKEENKNVISFAIMPFKYEKDRIFNSGISLKRLKTNSNCTIVIDNDAFLDSNPNLSAKTCFEITNSAILHVVGSLSESSIDEEAQLLTGSNSNTDYENSLKDSMKMLYENALPNSVRRSLIYVIGGKDAPIGMINAISKISGSILNEDGAQVEVSTSSSEESKIVMLSSVQGETRFDRYDPLDIIPKENSLDWENPECSINCNLDLKQLE
ncbi:MAG TPA: cell division protein FtsZ [Nitrosopumilaceae archaeon]|nr:cell division protein FtsZ [Nitrosopumilaceae archaeon]